jgi:hypothetical protein
VAWKPLIFCGACALMVEARAYAQAPTEEYAVRRVTAVFLQQHTFVDVDFTDPLELDDEAIYREGNVTLESLPSATDLRPGKPARLPGRRMSLRVMYAAHPADSDDTLRICFAEIVFRDPAGKPRSAAKLCGGATILRADGIVAAIADQVKTLTETPAISTELPVFASGFLVAAEGETEGGTDLHLNGLDLGLPGLHAFLHLRKSSAEEGDPRNFEAGASYRATVLRDTDRLESIRAQLQMLRRAPTPEARLAASQSIDETMKAIQRQLLAGYLFDVGGRLEGQATNFNVTNAVAEVSTHLQSRTKSLFGARRGFWRFRVSAGVEAGGTLREPDEPGATDSVSQALERADWIARLKAGATLTLLYVNDGSARFLRRLEFEAGVVHRGLLVEEVRFDDVTQTNNTTDTGHRPYAQADLKAYFFETAGARYGAKISYAYGSLPPVYSKVSSVQFGFLFERTR